MQEIGFVEPAQRAVIFRPDQEEGARDGTDTDWPVRFRRPVQRPAAEPDGIPERQRIAPGAALSVPPEVVRRTEGMGKR